MKPSIATQLGRISNLGIMVHNPGLTSALETHEAKSIADALVDGTNRYPILLHSTIRPLRHLFFSTSADLDPGLGDIPDDAGAGTTTAPTWNYSEIVVNDKPSRTYWTVKTQPGDVNPAIVATGAYGMIWHELGHVLAMATGVSKPASSLIDLMLDTPNIKMSDYLNKFGLGQDDALTISRYAASSSTEALAEFFAMWNVPGFRETLSPVLGPKVERLINNLANGGI